MERYTNTMTGSSIPFTPKKVELPPLTSTPRNPDGIVNLVEQLHDELSLTEKALESLMGSLNPIRDPRPECPVSPAEPDAPGLKGRLQNLGRRLQDHKNLIHETRETLTL